MQQTSTLPQRENGATEGQSEGQTLKILAIVTPLASLATALSLFLAMFTASWMHTEEKGDWIPSLPYRIESTQRDIQLKHTTSGLWAICINQDELSDSVCDYISYFASAAKYPSNQDLTSESIIYAVRGSCLYFIIGCVFILAGQIFCFDGEIFRKKKLMTFISGILLILGGLTLLSGIIVYISIFKSEMGPLLTSRTKLSSPKVRFKYGYSFLFMIISFLLSEISGICSIFLFIYHHQEKWTNTAQRTPNLSRRQSSSSSYQRGSGTPDTSRKIDVIQNGDCREGLQDTKSGSYSLADVNNITTSKPLMMSNGGVGVPTIMEEYTNSPKPMIKRINSNPNSFLQNEIMSTYIPRHQPQLSSLAANYLPTSQSGNLAASYLPNSQSGNLAANYLPTSQPPDLAGYLTGGNSMSKPSYLPDRQDLASYMPAFSTGNGHIDVSSYMPAYSTNSQANLSSYMPANGSSYLPVQLHNGLIKPHFLSANLNVDGSAANLSLFPRQDTLSSMTTSSTECSPQNTGQGAGKRISIDPCHTTFVYSETSSETSSDEEEKYSRMPLRRNWKKSLETVEEGDSSNNDGSDSLDSDQPPPPNNRKNNSSEEKIELQKLIQIRREKFQEHGGDTS